MSYYVTCYLIIFLQKSRKAAKICKLAWLAGPYFKPGVTQIRTILIRNITNTSNPCSYTSLGLYSARFKLQTVFYRRSVFMCPCDCHSKKLLPPCTQTRLMEAHCSL